MKRRRVTLEAPAKINLALDVTGKRADGYHLLETVFQTVSIWDMVTVELTPQPEISLTCDNSAVPCDSRNIAWRAAERYRTEAGFSEGIQLTLQKQIPMEAGLGGGSTDGAAVLLALQKLTENALSEEKLKEIAVSLGADVPFFLMGGTAYAAGIGEILEPLPAFPARYLVIAKGTAGVSTAEAYRAIDSLENPVHPPVQQLRQALEHRAKPEEVAPLCGNLFSQAVQLEEVEQIRQRMLGNGALCSEMTGSGSAVFGLFLDWRQAKWACARLQQQFPFAVCCQCI